MRIAFDDWESYKRLAAADLDRLGVMVERTFRVYRSDQDTQWLPFTVRISNPEQLGPTGWLCITETTWHSWGTSYLQVDQCSRVALLTGAVDMIQNQAAVMIENRGNRIVWCDEEAQLMLPWRAFFKVTGVRFPDVSEFRGVPEGWLT